MQIEGLPCDELAFRKALGHFASGVAIITVVDDGIIHGTATNVFCPVSLQPPLVMISVGQQSRIRSILPRSRFYGISVLGRDQETFARHFAGRPQTSLQVSFTWQQNCPLLAGALLQLVCKITNECAAGDHMLYIGQVVYLNSSDEHAPLLFYSGRYQGVEEQSSQYPAYIYDPTLW
jgi:flavin reductase (DIM6/NTAB) family NADH-FMN oxidoreductase RutF